MWCLYNKMVRCDGSAVDLRGELTAGKTELGLFPLILTIATTRKFCEMHIKVDRSINPIPLRHSYTYTPLRYQNHFKAVTGLSKVSSYISVVF